MTGNSLYEALHLFFVLYTPVAHVGVVFKYVLAYIVCFVFCDSALVVASLLHSVTLQCFFSK